MAWFQDIVSIYITGLCFNQRRAEQSVSKVIQCATCTCIKDISAEYSSMPSSPASAIPIWCLVDRLQLKVPECPDLHDPVKRMSWTHHENNQILLYEIMLEPSLKLTPKKIWLYNYGIYCPKMWQWSPV